MTKRVLIAEDTLQVVDRLKEGLTELIQSHGDSPDFDTLTTQRAARHCNAVVDDDSYDLVLLDYYAPDGNFHVLDLEKIGPQKVIAISSIEQRNRQAESRNIYGSVVKNNPITDDILEEIISMAEYILYTKFENNT